VELPLGPVYCPNESDVGKSIDECQKLFEQAHQLMRDLGNSNAPDKSELEAKITDWQNKQAYWRAKNEQLIEGCGLLPGADGTEVFPQLPVALENLKRAGEWLNKSMVAASLSHFSASKIYIAGTRKAINQARAVLSGRVRPNCRAAIVKTPSQIAALEKRLESRQAEQLQNGQTVI
jgi:hypothetical protein